MGNIKKIGDKLAHSNGVVFEFLRSAVSSQTASWVDMLLSFALFAWVHLAPWLATACGALAGGIINCIINYRFTFHAQGQPWKAVAVKYTLIWIGSVTFNSLGTEAMYWLLKHWTWLESQGFRPDGFFAAARLFISLVVSWCWNFVMQRNFVYRAKSYDDKFVCLIDCFLPKRFRSSRNA